MKKSEENLQLGAADAPSTETTTLLQNALKLLTGAGAAQILRALLSPLIARLFSPAALGIAQNYSAIGKTGAVLATLRYEDSIQLPQDKSIAFRQMLIALLFTGFNSVLSLCIILFVRHPLAIFLNAPELSNLLFTLPLFILARGAFLTLRSWHIRKESYARVSAAALAENALWDGGALGLGVTGLTGSTALIGAQITGQAAAAGLLALPAIKRLRRFHFTWHDMGAGMREYRKFPLFNTWSKLLDNTALYLPALLFSAFFSPAVAGQFTLGFNLLQLPFSMIANALGQVLYQQAPSANRAGSLDELIDSLLNTGVKAAIFPVALFAIIGQEIVTLVFGANWAQAGAFAQILSPWMLFIFLSLTIERIPAVLGKNENILLFHVINTAVRTTALIIGRQSSDGTLSVVLLSIGGCLIYGGNILSVASLTGLTVHKTLGSLSRGITLCIPFTLGLLVLKMVLPTTLNYHAVILITVGVILSGFYYAILLLKDTQVRELVRTILKKK